MAIFNSYFDITRGYPICSKIFPWKVGYPARTGGCSVAPSEFLEAWLMWGKWKHQWSNFKVLISSILVHSFIPNSRVKKQTCFQDGFLIESDRWCQVYFHPRLETIAEKPPQTGKATWSRHMVPWTKPKSLAVMSWFIYSIKQLNK
jgi:hypothetical protein